MSNVYFFLRIAPYLALASVSLGAVPAAAFKYATPALQLIDSVTVVGERVDADDVKCGITQGLLTDAVKYPLVNSPIKPVAKSDVVVDVSVTTKVVAQNTCITIYDVDVSAYTTVLRSDKSFLGKVELWSGGGFLMRPRSTQGKELRRALEEEVKSFLVSWSDAKAGILPAPFNNPLQVPR